MNQPTHVCICVYYLDVNVSLYKKKKTLQQNKFRTNYLKYVLLYYKFGSWAPQALKRDQSLVEASMVNTEG